MARTSVSTGTSLELDFILMLWDSSAQASICAVRGWITLKPILAMGLFLKDVYLIYHHDLFNIIAL